MTYQNSETIFHAEKELLANVPMDNEKTGQCRHEGCTTKRTTDSALCEKHKKMAEDHFIDQMCWDAVAHLKRDIQLRFNWTWLYFVGCRDSGMVKIGVTGNLKQRMSALRNSSPIPIKLFHAVCMYPRAEYLLHERFAEHRKHGEWFELSDEISQCIEDIKVGDADKWIEEDSIPGLDEMVEEMAYKVAGTDAFEAACEVSAERRVGKAIDYLRTLCVNRT